MKRYIVQQTMFLYQEIEANSKKEAIEKANYNPYGGINYGDVKVSAGSQEGTLYLMEAKYSAKIIDKQIED